MSNEIENENNSSNHLSFKFWILVILLCTFLGLCLVNATKSYNGTGKSDPKEELGANVTINFDKNTNEFGITDYAPVKDYLGKSSLVDKSFDFTVDVHLKQAKVVIYEISLKKDSTSNINDNDVHIYLEKMNPLTNTYEAVFEPMSFKMNEEETKVGTPKGYMLLNNQTVTDTGKDYYRLRMWMTENSMVGSGNYKVEVILNAKAE